jgi:hypothetical protein
MVLAGVLAMLIAVAAAAESLKHQAAQLAQTMQGFRTAHA